MHFERIAIVGLGLIGGSFALAARQARIAEKITGYDTGDVLEYALAHNYIDDVETAFRDGSESEADLVYLATPVRAIIDFLRTRARHLKRGAIIMDAGSTKREIFLAARESLSEGVHFVGGHPMAGSERTGIEAATADLFRDAPYAVVASGESKLNDRDYSAAADAVLDVVLAIGGRPVITNPVEHDRAVARVSQMPQLLSTALAVAVAKKGEGRELVGAGFADMTRLAGSRWSVWEDICRTNADEISTALDEVIAEIEAMRADLVEGRFSELAQAFGRANESTRDF